MLKVSRRLMIQVIIVSDFILTEAIMKFKCDDCEKEYARIDGLKRHREEKHAVPVTHPPPVKRRRVDQGGEEEGSDEEGMLETSEMSSIIPQLHSCDFMK